MAGAGKKGKQQRIRKGKYGRRPKMTLVNNTLAPFSQRYITKMKYSQTFSISSLGTNRYMFNLNNIFDPDRSGVGHQPYGYDQLGAIYNRYRVITCHWAINMYPSEGSSPIRVCALPANEEITNTTLSDACEDPRAKWLVQVPGANGKVLKGKTYLPSLLGRTRAEYRASQGPLWNAAPSELAILNIYAQGLNDVTANATGTITLTYYVECFDPHTLPQS